MAFMGMGYGALGIGHWALGMGRWAWEERGKTHLPISPAFHLPSFPSPQLSISPAFHLPISLIFLLPNPPLHLGESWVYPNLEVEF
jgi:hypothetical protein